MFLFFGCTEKHVRYQFPDQDSTPAPCSGSAGFNPWITREVLLTILNISLDIQANRLWSLTLNFAYSQRGNRYAQLLYQKMCSKYLYTNLASQLTIIYLDTRKKVFKKKAPLTINKRLRKLMIKQTVLFQLQA